jgi:hypothetical protein
MARKFGHWLRQAVLGACLSITAAALPQLLFPAPVLAAPAAPQSDYRTEWVWLLSIYEDQLRSLAQAVSDKYRNQLNIPDGMYVTPDQWLDANATIRFTGVNDQVGGVPFEKDVTIEQTGCLGGARAEFGARKKRLDDAFALSFSRWSQVIARRDIGSAAVLWWAKADVTLLASRVDDSWTARWKRYVLSVAQSGLSELIGEASKASVSAAIDKLGLALPSAVLDKAVDKAGEKLADAVTGALKESLLKPDKPTLAALADQLSSAA